MKTQLEYAQQDIITEKMKTVALAEGLSKTFIKYHVAMGEIIIPCNPRRKNQKITGIGTELRTKVNASIGTSSNICDINLEVLKAQAAEEEGADTTISHLPSVLPIQPDSERILSAISPRLNTWLCPVSAM